MNSYRADRIREVGARRARKLRKRGAYVWFSRWTANGKCRYHWIPGHVRES